MINQVPAPIYYVSPTQILVMFSNITTPSSVVQIQVVNNAADSNIVTQFTRLTSVGVFINGPIGCTKIAAAERPDYSIVSESNPTNRRDIGLYLAGVGAVSNQPADGTAAPGSPLSDTTSTPLIYITDSLAITPRRQSPSLALLPDSPACIRSIPRSLPVLFAATYPWRSLDRIRIPLRLIFH